MSTTPGQSSYVRLLPPVLWERDPSPPAFSLGAMLQVFEKLLTGIDDGASITHENHEHPSIAAEIEALPELYDPWRTKAAFLPWLASWVALEFPAIWNEYQQRKMTAQMVEIYSLRGLRDGLQEYLDLYTLAATRPRIAIDDGSRLLTTRLAPGAFSALTTLVSQGPSLHRPVPPPATPPQGAPDHRHSITKAQSAPPPWPAARRAISSSPIRER